MLNVFLTHVCIVRQPQQHELHVHVYIHVTSLRNILHHTNIDADVHVITPK